MSAVSDHFRNLLFGFAVALVIPAICFVLGVAWSRLIGGWGDTKFRKWWTTFCLLMPFIAFGMMVRRMAEDRFEAVRLVWAAEPFHLIAIVVIAAVISIGL